MTWPDPCNGGTALRRVLAFATIGLASLLGGCVQDGLMDMALFQLKPDDIIIERRPEREYEKLFPYYIKLCAASQFRTKLTGEVGGPAGHAILYIKGACRDEDAAFPQLRRCRGLATSLKDPEHGAGVSVNQLFENVNWVATPGYELVFPGGNAGLGAGIGASAGLLGGLLVDRSWQAQDQAFQAGVAAGRQGR
jgi:hypothetical protein